MTQRLSTHGIGASEIAAIAGLSPYASPWDIWLRKTGQAPDVEESPEMEWGLRLEPAIRQKYADLTGATMYVPSESLFHPERHWARATPDAIVLEDAEPLARWQHLLQCKAPGYWPGKDWDEGPPSYVQLQEQWEMFVADLQRADVAALIAGSDFRVYTVHRAEGLIADLVDIAEAFWRKVETRTPPQVDESKACRDHFTRQLAKAPPAELVADNQLVMTLAEWREARAVLKATEKQLARLRNEVLSTMTGAQVDRIVSPIGSPKLARTPAREHQEIDWKYVATLLGSTDRERFDALVKAATTTTTTEATVSLREPREWSKGQP